MYIPGAPVVAFIVAVLPRHIVGLFTVAIGDELIVRLSESVFIHPDVLVLIFV